MLPTFYEFFAGGGMVRAALTPEWTCLLANDIDPKKAAAYVENWGEKEFKLGNIYDLKISDLPDFADLAWASFPCQDLSLAGSGAGLNGERSGAFWGFWKAINSLKAKGRAPRILILENVCGTLTSHGGADFVEICRALASLNYNFGAVVIDAVRFVPQSRPRLFFIAVFHTQPVPLELKDVNASGEWHPRALQSAQSLLSPHVRKRWIWWKLRIPARRNQVFADVIEQNPSDVKWHTSAETGRLLKIMSPGNRAKVEAAKRSGKIAIGTIYKRTRKDESGRKVQRAEVRFDDIAGCLRTPAGGSSRQLILVVNGKNVKSRLISSRETARLMGLSEEFVLPENYNEAYHLTGDGVVVPVVRHLAQNIVVPIIRGQVLLQAAE